ncbi:hypothetical protein JHK82_040002 [Glycine max]|nr:hypothetical protein JHK82_040002 [Glycine max]
MQVMEFLRKCSEWRENITNLGLQGALRNFLDPHFVEGSCSHSYFVSSRENERPSEGTVMCQECKRPMKNFVVHHDISSPRLPTPSKPSLALSSSIKLIVTDQLDLQKNYGSS